MNEVEAKSLKKGDNIILVTYAKIYPDEYYIKKRGRRKSVTSYKIDTNIITEAKQVTIDTVSTHRKTIDMDSREMITRIQYFDKNHVSGTLAIAPETLFSEISNGAYIQSSQIHLLEQVNRILND